jgi:hypothetical protein
LGKTHQPHISCLQRYVRTADLEKVYDAVGKVLAAEKPTTWKLRAYKYYYLPWKEAHPDLGPDRSSSDPGLRELER